MKRSEIKRRPLADTALASLKPEDTPYRELDGNGLYFRVKPNGQKSWNFRYKKPDGKWSWLGLGSYPRGQRISRQAESRRAARRRLRREKPPRRQACPQGFRAGGSQQHL